MILANHYVYKRYEVVLLKFKNNLLVLNKKYKFHNIIYVELVKIREYRVNIFKGVKS